MIRGAGPQHLVRIGFASLAVVVLAAALAVRLHEIDQPLVTFRAIRHYRSAIIAHDFYVHAASGIPQWAIKVADANRALQQAGEPPLMELLACLSYLTIGRETTAIPRAYAAIAWVLGAIPLFFVALRVGSPRGALIACALYLFLPYGIIASRNFQPDALMTLASLAAILAMLRHHEEPIPERRYAAIALVGLAILIKPMSIFLVLPVLIGLHLLRMLGNRPSGLARTKSLELIITGALCLIPAGIFYGYHSLFGSLVRDQMHMRFVPQLVMTSFFWGGLLRQIQKVFTLPFFLIGLLGILIGPKVPGRVLLISLWIGWCAFAFAFTYHMPTHDYYHWPYIAAVALGVAAVVSRVEDALTSRVPPRAMLGVVAVASVAIAVWGTMTAWPRLTVPGAAAELTRYHEIGQLTEHDVKVLFLDYEYGYPLMYHAEVSGDTWPNQDDLAAEKLGGAETLTAEQRFERDYQDFGPKYFVITDLESLEGQPDLQALLAARATIVRRTNKYHVYKFVAR
jgi:hypothetical protein